MIINKVNPSYWERGQFSGFTVCIEGIVYVGQADPLSSYSVYSEELPLLKTQSVPSLKNKMVRSVFEKHCLILSMCLGPSVSNRFYFILVCGCNKVENACLRACVEVKGQFCGVSPTKFSSTPLKGGKLHSTFKGFQGSSQGSPEFRHSTSSHWGISPAQRLS